MEGEDVSTILLPANRIGDHLAVDHIGDNRNESQIKSPRIKLKYQGISRNQYQIQKMENREKTIQVVRMLVAIVVVFVVCWTPLLIIHILQSLDVIKLQIQGWAKHGKTVSSLMAYLNSALNPIIYGFMSHNFRESFKKAMASLFHPVTKRIRRGSRTPDGHGHHNESKQTSPLGLRSPTSNLTDVSSSNVVRRSH
ncbi:hypothetical protein TCAL_12732 [Tigriopus californicus]|uniref:G-protein coupled receptors family 1 profile domain-containing protein n=1 Tax=Tigriopus californicus TaxID=6832 RepID=A0A553P4D2_TIGCA|nr:hypothetical protein TCAL_12732 [Tigriopus californicus]